LALVNFVKQNTGMKYKLFTALILIFMFTSAVAQNTVTVFLNGVKKGEYITKTDETTGVGTIVKKTDCKKLKQLSVQIKGEHIGMTVYKRTIEVTDNAGLSFLNVPETVGTPGKFILTGVKLKSLLTKGKPIKLYLLMDPADDRSMIPSKRIYMGTITAK
jgi:hypothetical protein